ncbi:hypothetical protein E8E12_005827 [Didymella heteroderae]|uniref:Integral membrane protein TmpA n=1 Tax=Didymella heteroderae TaxID=1769908 RepID=A0A9P4WL09_9PLEO|nr:hypothetical protein E8E12_005827 [Didymella heteroderae]
MSYIQRQREATGPAKTPCQSPVKSAPIPSGRPTAIFDPDQFRLIEPPRRIIDLEKGPQHSHFGSSLRSSRSDASICSSTALLEKASSPTHQSLPPKRHHRITRRLRYSLFAVYQCLFTFVFLLNAAAVLVLLHLSSWHNSKAFQVNNLATLASSNFLLAILFRQDWLVNLLFRTAWLVPWSLPLRIRRIVSRVYCYGGIHSGAAVAGTSWWIAFTCMLSWEGVAHGSFTPFILVLTLVIASLLITIVTLSLPGVRARYHDTWELTHRFLGWLSILLFWAQILLLTSYISVLSPELSFASTLTHTPTFWTLIAITALLVYPWLLLRRWTFTATLLSDHALQLSFPNKVHKYSCLVLSDSPLREWHPFATFPSAARGADETGNSLVVSAAGDWTQGLISRAQQHTPGGRKSDMRFWVKSHPRAGVLSLSCIYARVLILTTGSGIGPCLSSLLDRPATQMARLVWSTRSPLRTYGEHMLRLVHEADPDALVLDTDQMGRPDLLSIAWSMYVEMQAEAVFVLSNERVTRTVVGGLERRGVPAFGPIWDS